MFKCKSCGTEYQNEESFMPSSDGAALDTCCAFDGNEMRATCPKCGGMIYPIEDVRHEEIMAA